MAEVADGHRSTAAPSPEPDGLLDPAALEELREIGPTFVDRVLNSYLRNAQDTATAIRAAAARDLQELARLAHKLLASSGTLARRQLAATCGTLEELLSPTIAPPPSRPPSKSRPDSPVTHYAPRSAPTWDSLFATPW
jgi:HPt (histidine-containing phosphotransfer) domain-containing protein